MHPLKSSVWELIGPGTNKYNALYRCVCGKVKYVNKYQVRHGRSLCCGCLTRKNNGVKHGLSNTPEYDIWNAMKVRCANPDHPDYGGRGIKVCARWAGSDSFPNFYADMGPRPRPELSIHRINNDKGYWCGKAECPECGPLGREGNCMWATAGVQVVVRRNTVWLTLGEGAEAVTKCRKDWARELGISEGVITYHMTRHKKTFAEVVEWAKGRTYKPRKQYPKVRRRKPKGPPPEPTLSERVIAMSMDVIGTVEEFRAASALAEQAMADSALTKAATLCLRQLIAKMQQFETTQNTLAVG